jgi:hypothetical protein
MTSDMACCHARRIRCYMHSDRPAAWQSAIRTRRWVLRRSTNTDTKSLLQPVLACRLGPYQNCSALRDLASGPVTVSGEATLARPKPEFTASARGLPRAVLQCKQPDGPGPLPDRALPTLPLSGAVRVSGCRSELHWQGEGRWAAGGERGPGPGCAGAIPGPPRLAMVSA